MVIKSQDIHVSWMFWSLLVSLMIVQNLLAIPLAMGFYILVLTFYNQGTTVEITHPLDGYDCNETTFFMSLFWLFGYVTHLNKRISEVEESFIDELILHMGLEQNHKEMAWAFFKQGSNHPEALDLVSSLVNRWCGRSQKDLLLFMLGYYASCDKALDYTEYEAMNTICGKLNVSLKDMGRYLREAGEYYQEIYAQQKQQQKPQSNARYDRTRSQSKSKAKAWYEKFYSNNQKKSKQKQGSTVLFGRLYEVLEIDSECSNDELKRGYRRLMNKYHPDKMISQGASDELVAEANKKVIKIRKAYDELKRLRG